ncbi:hypothetical protein EON66_06180 [archaeon]|nr:MAG: hypothetical protein EON66_06180 [archaeon]
MQGKSDDWGSVGLHTESVYSLKSRTNRVLRLLARDAAVSGSVNAVHMRAAVDRLRNTLITYHDALQCYHDIWFAIRLHVGSTYYADATGMTLTIPHDFAPTVFAQFVRDHLPRFVSRAMTSAVTPAAKRQAASAAAVARGSMPPGTRSASGRPHARDAAQARRDSGSGVRHDDAHHLSRSPFAHFYE